jgi:hypothetical protein
MRPNRLSNFKWLNRTELFAVFAFCFVWGQASAADFDASKLPPAPPGPIDFARDIKPLLDGHCLKCHSDEKPKSHFRLTSREAALRGGEHGVDIFPGRSERSPLLFYVAGLVEDLAMPPAGRGVPLTSQEVGRLRAWIDQGVVWGPTTNVAVGELIASPIVGWTTVHGDALKFRELYLRNEGWDGGLEHFEAETQPSPDTQISTTGHVLRDDYLVTLNASKDDLGFAHFGWDQFRKYYDDLGGYNPLVTPSPLELNRGLFLDIGRAHAEFGLTLPRWPRFVLGYEDQYREGTESTLQWGPVGDGTLTNNVYPALKTISERVHILKFDADYELAGMEISDNFRGEWYRLSTRELNGSGYTLGAPAATAAAFTTANESQSYFAGANTFRLEKQFTDWFFGAGGYLYSKLNASGSADVENANLPALNMPSIFFPGYPGFQSERIELERESHVFSLSTMVGPWHGLSLTLGTQNEWTRQTGLTTANVSLALPFGMFSTDPENLYSDLDRRSFSQEAGLRFTSLPFTTLYADARLQEDDFGQYQDQTGGITPFLQKSDAKSALQDLRFGFNTSPWQRVSLSGQFRRYDNETDYAYPLKAVGPPNEGYPAFFKSRDLLSNQAEAKLALQLTAWLKTSLSYQWLANQYHTATDPVTADPFTGVPGISPGGQLLAGTYDAHMGSLNSTLTPWRRLFLSTTVSYQNARTITSGNNLPSVVPYAGNIYSALVNGNYTLDSKTTLLVGYSLSRGDFNQANSGAGLPLGIAYWQQTIQAGLKRQVGKNATLGLQYQFYHYQEPSAGGFDNFTAHTIFATLLCRFP